MNKPAIVTTNKPLPFAELSPPEFERMCLWLLDREGYERLQHPGEAGSEQGRDIIAQITKGTSKETWYFQCKRRNRITSTDLKREVDKYNRLSIQDSRKKPTGVVFITNAVLSARIRDEVDDYCQLFGYECLFWARTELDLLVKKHKDIVQEFFYIFGDPGRSSLTNCAPAVLRMVEDYSVVFGGRDKEVSKLNEFLNKDAPCALLIAPTGRGKTALLIHWTTSVRLNEEWFVVFHPISQRYQTATADATLSTLSSGLAEFHGLNVRGFDTSPDQLRFLVNELLRSAPPNGKKLLIVLDGLDETIGWNIDRTLFPREIPAHVKVVASVRELARRKPEYWIDQLGWKISKTSIMGLALLDQLAVSELLSNSTTLKQTISNEELVSQLLRVSEGEPLTIRYIVEALQDEELTLQKLSNVPPGLEAFIDYWIRELEPAISKDVVAYNFLGLLGAAVAPLAESDFASLAPEMFSRSVVATDVVRTVQRFVIGDGSNENGYVLSHPRLREIFFERLSPTEQTTFRKSFVEYGIPFWRERSIKLPSYVRLHWIKQLAAASEWSLIREVLTEFELNEERPRQPWCHIRFKNEGSYAGYLSDIDVLWDKAEKSSNLVLSARCATIFSSIRSLSGNFAPELIADLVAVGSSEGQWPFSAGIDYIKQIPDPEIQIVALKELYTQASNLHPEHAFNVIDGIPYDRNRARALEVIAPLVDQKFANQMAATVQSIREPYARSIALCALASRLLKPQKTEALQEAEKAAKDIAEMPLQIAALAKIAIQHPRKSMTICKQALDYAIHIEEVVGRWKSLAALGPVIPERLMTAFLGAVGSLEIDGRKADIFSGMLDRLPPEAHDEVWRLTISRLSERMVAIRCPVGTKLAQSKVSLSSELREQLIPIAKAIEEPQGRARALAALAYRMPAESQRPMWNEVIESTRMVQHPEMAAETSPKAGTWLDILPLIPADVAADIWTEALESTLGMFSDHHGLNYDLFCDLIKFLPSDLLPLALGSARKGEIKPMLSKRLVNIGRRFGGNKQKALLGEAVLATQQLEDSRGVAEAIGSIGPHLPSDAASRRIEVARTLGHNLTQFTALQGLARGLNNDAGISVWEDALSMVRAHHSDSRHDWANWLALRDVIGHVPDELLHRLLEIGLNMRHSEARAKTLAEIAKRFSDGKARLIWQQVLNASASSVSSLGLALSNLQPEVAPETLAELWKGVLEASISIEKSFSRNLAIKGLAPYLPSSLSVVVMDYTDHMDGAMEEMDKIDILTRLVPNLGAELFPRFISIAHASSNSWAISRLLGVLSSRFADNQKDSLLDEALKNLEQSDSDFDRSYGLEGIAPNLLGKFTDRALAIALAISDPSLRASALIAFGDALPFEAAIEALHSVSLISEWSTRVRLLREVAVLLATKCRTSPVFTKDSYLVWAETLRVLSRYGRNDLLQGISALVPWLATFATSQDFDQMLDGILETRCSWS